MFDPTAAASGDVADHVPTSDPDLREVKTSDPWIEGSANGFDFWEFRHGLRGDRAPEGRDYTRQVVGNRLRPAGNGPDTSHFSPDLEPE